MKDYTSPLIKVINMCVENGIAAGSGSAIARAYNVDSEVLEQWVEDDDVTPPTWEW